MDFEEVNRLLTEKITAIARKDAVAPRRRAPLRRATLHNKMALLFALAEWKYIRKSSVISRDGRI
jgi:hypothetical protein